MDGHPEWDRRAVCRGGPVPLVVVWTVAGPYDLAVGLMRDPCGLAAGQSNAGSQAPSSLSAGGGDGPLGLVKDRWFPPPGALRVFWRDRGPALLHVPCILLQ